MSRRRNSSRAAILVCCSALLLAIAILAHTATAHTLEADLAATPVATAATAAAHPLPAAVLASSSLAGHHEPPSPASQAFKAAANYDPATDAADQILAGALERLQRDGPLAGAQAHRQFCRCNRYIHDAATCDTLTSACRDAFCMPMCVSSSALSAWSIELHVNCALAPQWKYCAAFKEQVAEASRALTAQFQAHVCVGAGFCNVTSALTRHVDNHLYGSKFPSHMLPIDSCLPELHALHPKVGEATCAACGRVLSARIRRGDCKAEVVPGYETQGRTTEEQRCEFVADFISTHAHSLLLELQQSLCSCLGCCDTAQGAHGAGKRSCFLPNEQGRWLERLVAQVERTVGGLEHGKRVQGEMAQAVRKVAYEEHARVVAAQKKEAKRQKLLKQRAIFMQHQLQQQMQPPSPSMIKAEL